METPSNLQSLRTQAKQTETNQADEQRGALALRVQISERLGFEGHAIFQPLHYLYLEELQECWNDLRDGELIGVRAWCEIARGRYPKWVRGQLVTAE